ncbi:MAG: hypothetical protein JNL19_00140 [Burkholderiales bacterium]|nr:hypothetical protein [Burkholderiales bacterium]
MKASSLTRSLVCALCLVAAPLAFAGGADDHKPKHGGIVSIGKAFDAELVAKADLITVYVNDHGKPMTSKGMKAKITMLNGTEKNDAELQPAGDNRLEAKGKFSVARGTKFVAVITPEGKSAATFRFELK